MSAWIYIDPNETTGGYLISKAWNDGGQYNYRLSLGTNGTGKIFFALQPGLTGAITITSPNALTTGWHHLAATVEGSTKLMSLYVDGGLMAFHQKPDWKSSDLLTNSMPTSRIIESERRPSVEQLNRYVEQANRPASPSPTTPTKLEIQRLVEQLLAGSIPPSVLHTSHANLPIHRSFHGHATPCQQTMRFYVDDGVRNSFLCIHFHYATAT